MGQLAGTRCGVCNQTILGLRDGAFCPDCESPVHVACASAPPQPSPVGHCPRCGTATGNGVLSAADVRPVVHTSQPAFRGSVRVFRLAGTDVFVHWTWFVATVLLFQNRPVPYSSLIWDGAEYLAGFGLVLLHEFGHVFACRRVGGSADRVVLWPLGGLAFVAHPPRPGAALWTTVAGPLVNLVLSPVLFLLAYLAAPPGMEQAPSDLGRLLFALAWFNVVVLVFNLLPIFPLDGGRIVYAALWWWLGRARALATASGIGILGGVGLLVFAVAFGDWWFAIMAGFLILGALGGLVYSRLLARLSVADHRHNRACASCGALAPRGAFWRCTRCLAWFDLLASPERCPKGEGHACHSHCFECGRPLTLEDWASGTSAGSTGDIAQSAAPGAAS